MADRDIEKRIEEFVSVFLETMGATTAPGVPSDMSVGIQSDDGWCEWRPIDSKITAEDIAAIEGALGTSLPPLFVRYLTFKCLLMTDFGVLSLPEVRSDRPLKDIELFVRMFERNSFWRTHKYIPFGQDGDAYGILAFDTAARALDGDCPIVVVDPELMANPGYVAVPKWGSFAELLDFVQESLLSFGKGTDAES